MGTEQALIFYEGLRPIRCRKIRYYRERGFRSRVLPPPATAIPGGRPGPSAGAGAPTAVGLSNTSSPPAPLAMNTLHPTEIATTGDRVVAPLTWADLPGEIQALRFEHAGPRPTADELAADARHFIATFAGIPETLHGRAP